MNTYVNKKVFSNFLVQIVLAEDGYSVCGHRYIDQTQATLHINVFTIGVIVHSGCGASGCHLCTTQHCYGWCRNAKSTGSTIYSRSNHYNVIFLFFSTKFSEQFIYIYVSFVLVV